MTVQGVTYQAGPAYSTQFQDSDDRSEEIAYQVSETPGGYLLTTAPELDQVWSAYGCAATDQLSIALRTPP